MGYRVHREDTGYKVVEVSNGEIREIKGGLTEDCAKSISRSLNFGAGFDSRTPDFFLNSARKIAQSV